MPLKNRTRGERKNISIIFTRELTELANNESDKIRIIQQDLTYVPSLNLVRYDLDVLGLITSQLYLKMFCVGDRPCT